MKVFVPLLVVFTAVIFSCKSKSNDSQLTSSIPDSVHSPKKIEVKLVYVLVRDHPTLDTTIFGYFNKDRIKDTAWVYIPVDSLHGEMFSCWPCITKVVFSGGIKGFAEENDIDGYVENLGDLDKDGIDEIGKSGSWFMGGWSRISVYKNVNGEWKQAAYSSILIKDEPLRIQKLIKNLGHGKILMYGDHHTWPDPTETVFDLKADSLPFIVSEKKFED